MNHPNPLLENGMIVWKGIDPRKDYCFYTFNVNRFIENKRSICFAEMAPLAEKLGFEILPHWRTHGQILGWYAIAGLQHHAVRDKQLYDAIEIDPIVEKILTQGLKNRNFKNLLQMEGE